MTNTELWIQPSLFSEMHDDMCLCRECEPDWVPSDFINDGGLGKGHYHVNGYPDGCVICDPEVEKYFNLYNCECDNCAVPQPGILAFDLANDYCHECGRCKWDPFFHVYREGERFCETPECQPLRNNITEGGNQ